MSARGPAVLFLFFIGSLFSEAAQPKVTIASAANFVYVLEALKTEFQAAHPDISIETVTGASGSLFAQVKSGAPYDLFLSADVDYPRQLIAADLADATSLTVFARGRLVFWSNYPGPTDRELEEVLRDPRLKKIALANPRNAPYGRAAKQVLERLGEWAPDSLRWVYGENVSQAAQFIESGNADAGFVALSLVLSPRLKGKVYFIEIPEGWHEPLDHAAILTRHGQASSEARLFLQFLREPAALKLLETFGYALPSVPAEQP